MPLADDDDVDLYDATLSALESVIALDGNLESVLEGLNGLDGYSFLDSVTGFAKSDFDANMSAIVDFFNRQTSFPNDAARKIKDDFSAWNNGLGWYDKSDLKRDETLTKARNFKTSFDYAVRPDLATPEAQQQRLQYGVTLEKAQGKPELARTSKGLIAEPPPDHTKYWLAALAGVGAVAAIVILGTIRKFTLV